MQQRERKAVPEKERKRAAEDISKRIKDFKILSSITQAVHQTLDLEEIYKITLDMTADLENVDMVTIYLVDEDRKEAVLQAQRNLPGDYIRRASRIPYPKGATWEVIKSGKVLNIEDIQKDPDVSPAGKDLGHHGLLGIPIALEGKVIGAIWFFSYKERKFDDGEVELLSSIGNQIAIAIAKTNLYRVLYRKNKYEKIVSTVTQSVHRSTDLQEVLENAVEAMTENIEIVEHISIYFVEGKEAVIQIQRGFPDGFIEKVRRIPYPKGFTWDTILEGKTRYCPDIDKDTIIGPAGRQVGTKSYVSIPLKIESNTIGCINIHSLNKDAFEEEDINLLEVVAKQIEIAINKANQAQALKESEEKLRKNLERLSKKTRFEEIISAVTRTVHKSLDLQEVLENAVESMSENIDVVNHVSIFLVEGTDAVMKVRRGYPDWFIEKIKRIPYPKGFTWDTILEGKTRYCPDIDKDTIIGPAGRQVGTKSYVSIPLKIESNTIGCINIHSLNKDAFEEEDINLLEVVAKQIEIAINKAQQAEALKQSEEALKKSEEHFRLLVETTNVIPWEADAKTFQFTYVGPQAQGLLGYPVEQWYEQDFWPSHIHPDECEKTIEKCLKSTAKKKDYELEYRMISSDGNIVWFHDLVSVITEDGEPKMLRGFMIDITEHRKAELEIEKLKNQLERENIYLKEEIKLSHNFDNIIGDSPSLNFVLSQIEEVAPTNSTVLIHGETGTGKSLFARAIHNLSNRRDRNFITVNCAAIPAELLESELFGREKGAYTGADSSQIGRFELADVGTIFLDEISELPYRLQAKLLKVIQEGEFEHLGNPKSIKVDVRIVSSTNRDLKELIKDNKFREDLYYRLNVYPIVIPPLNQRKNDIQLLVNHFVNKHSRKMGKSIDKIPAEVIKQLKSFQWPGNVRELENVIERAVITTKGDTLRIMGYFNQSDLVDSNRNDRVRLYDVEYDHIVKVLNDTDWRIEGNSGAAAALGLPPSTLRTRMKKLGIKRPKINN